MSLVIHNLHSSFSHPLLQLVFVHIMQEWVETNGGVVAGTLTCLRWMSSKGIHSHYLFDNCFEVLCVVCRRVKITWGCHWLSQSCSEVVFELHQHIHTLWHSHNCIVRLVGMQSSNVVLQVPAYMQLNKISETIYLYSGMHPWEHHAYAGLQVHEMAYRFRCSKCRSRGMLYPSLPWVLTKRLQISCLRNLSLKRYFSCMSITRPSYAYLQVQKERCKRP